MISLDVDTGLLRIVAAIAEEALFDDLQSTQYLSEENAMRVREECRELLGVVEDIYAAVNAMEEVDGV